MAYNHGSARKTEALILLQARSDSAKEPKRRFSVSNLPYSWQLALLPRAQAFDCSVNKQSFFNLFNFINMAQIQMANAISQKSSRQFIGKAWINRVEKPGSRYNGTKYLVMTIDNKFKSITIGQDEKMIAWPNAKRQGKKDADFRVSIVSGNAPTDEPAEQAVDELI